MRMDSGIYVVLLGLIFYVHSGSTFGLTDDSQSVWLKDVTARSNTHKRIFDDPVLPHHLTFHMRQGSRALNLTLKRNYDIDPNADIYIVRKSKDGRSIPTKTRTLQREAVAYYQDMEHGAYMTVRCVNRLNQQCERVISGNIQIGNTSFHLIPAETDDRHENVLEASYIIGKRYLLLDQLIQEENVFNNKDILKVHKKKAQEELKVHSRLFTGQEKETCVKKADVISRYQRLEDLKKRETPDETRQLKENYFVKVAVLIDSGVWDYYYSKFDCLKTVYKIEKVKRTIREAYSHIMNGVSLRYQSIKDPSISIRVILSAFIFFLDADSFPHNHSKVIKEYGIKYIEAKSYMHDIYNWDALVGWSHLPNCDHVMLFTKHELYESPFNYCINGISLFSEVCNLGNRISLIETGDYVRTVGTATHELGHNLGAYHDGEGEALACRSEDLFIMTDYELNLSKDMPRNENMWTFSSCSVESFKKTLRNKQCVKYTGWAYNINEYNEFISKTPGSIFTPQEHCSILYGPGFVNYRIVPEEICHVLRCHNPTTLVTMENYMNAARGTKCGINKWCFQGSCVSNI